MRIFITCFLMFSAALAAQVPSSINNQPANVMAGNFYASNPTGKACTVNKDVALYYNGIMYACKGATGVNNGAYVQANQSMVTLVATDFVNAGPSFTGGNNGISNAVAACPAAPTQCLVEIPGNYPDNDTVLGFSPNFVTTDTSPYASNVIIRDDRSTATYSTNACPYLYSNQCSLLVKQDVFYAPQTTGFPSVANRVEKWSILGGGRFDGGNVSNYQPQRIYVSKTPGQFIGPSSYDITGTAPSDVLGGSQLVACPGGVGAPGFAEGCEWEDVVVSQTGAEWEAAVTSAGSALSSITVGAATQGAGSLGEQRWLVDGSSTPTLNTVSAMNCSDFSANPCLITMGTPVVASTALGTVATAVTVLGSQTVTPTLTVGAVTNFSTTSLVCVGDPGNPPEMIYPSAVGGSTLTLNFKFIHNANYIISTGGPCGQVGEFVADRLTSASHPEVNFDGQGITGTLHRAWMVLAAPTTGTIYLATQGKGGWRGPGSLWNATTNNQIAFWQAARVMNISTTPGLDAGTNGGTFAIANNNISWNTGDTAEEFEGPGASIGLGHFSIVNYFGNFGDNGQDALGIDWYGIMDIGDRGFDMNNHTPVSYYSINGGTYTPPTAAYTSEGQYQYNIQNYTGGQYGDVTEGCPSNGCVNTIHDSYQMSDNVGGVGSYETLGVNEVTGDIYLTANARVHKWVFNGGLDTPFGNFTAHTGSSGVLAETSGPITIGHCATFDASGDVIDSGFVACGSPIAPTANHPGSLVGTPTYTTGKFGQALNGSTTNYLTIPTGAFTTPTGNFTIEAWLQTTYTGLSVAVASNSHGWLGASGGQCAAGVIGFPTSFISSGISISDGNWHHCAVVVSVSGPTETVSFFVDGVAGASSSYNTPLSAFTDSGSIGTITNNPDFNWNGAIDEVAIWGDAAYTTAFTPPSAPYIGNEPGLVALYHLNGNALDSSIAIFPGTTPHSIGATFDGGGVALASGKTTYVTMPYSCTIRAWNMTADTGTATVDIWKVATGTALPTISNTITASATPALATGTAIHSTTLTGWTTLVEPNDIFGFNLKAVSGATQVSVGVQCQ